MTGQSITSWLIPLTDADFIQSIRQGDRKAEEALCRRFLERVRLVVSMRVGDANDRQELVQDILLAAILSLREGKFDANRGTALAQYIHGIIKNRIAQYYKDRHRRLARQEEVRLEFPAMAEPPAESDTDQSHERKVRLRHALVRLAPKYREVIYLRYHEGLAVHTIGERLGIAPSKVSDRLKYAKQLLYQHLSRTDHSVSSFQEEGPSTADGAGEYEV